MTMNLSAGEYQLSSVQAISVILGKNGCGKSKLLTRLDEQLAFDGLGLKRYITPERSGMLQHDPNVERNIQSNADWMKTSRRANQAQQFRQQSVWQYRKLELATYRRAEDRGEVAAFIETLNLLNSLLDNVELRRHDQAFTAHSKATGESIEANRLSSGESELIALGIELLAFSCDLEEGKPNILLLDEPDVHLHPDLQSRLVAFMRSLVDEHKFTILLATHSTAILGALSDYPTAAVALMRAGETALAFEAISDVHRKVLPVFGAHPLSNVFNQAPVLVVEGDDDVRVWQQTVRSSQGKVAVYPVPCDTVAAIAEYETEVARIVECVYDNGRALSLRDGDGEAAQLDDVPPVVRMRLACRASENLILADEVLASVGLDWSRVIDLMNQWIAANDTHVRYADMVAFRDGGFDRKGYDLKELRMLLVGAILSSSKPWEVLVGQTLGAHVHVEGALAAKGSLEDFLGPKVVAHLCRTS